MSDEMTKRGPGRPRKVAPEGAVLPMESAATIEVAEPVAVEDATPEPFWRVKVVVYKVHTSQGRGIESQFMELPADEAQELIADGKVKDARIN